MQNPTNLRLLTRLAPLSAAALLFATGCGSTTTSQATPQAADGTLAPAEVAREGSAPTVPATITTATSVPATTTTTTTMPATATTPASTTTVPATLTTTTTAPAATTTDPEPGPEPVGGLTTLPSVPRPTITLPPLLDSPAIVPPPCGTFGAIPAGSTITSDLSVALDADGVADDQVITYTSDVDRLRTVHNGAISEFEVPDVGVSHIRALGVGNAAEISTGNEVFVRTRGGASGAVVGIFGHDADGCLFEFTRFGAALEMYVGATIGNSSGAYCGEGIIAEWAYTQDTDGTYFGSSAAYFESTAGDFTYLPSSDDFSEGLDVADLSPAELDCFGFGL